MPDPQANQLQQPQLQQPQQPVPVAQQAVPGTPPALQPVQQTVPAAQVDRVSVKLPPFWKNDPKLSFIQLEAQFQLSGINRDITKYNHVVSAIDTEILQQVADFVTNPPITHKYEGIKDRLINTFSDSNERKLRKLLSEIELGDKKPSQLLNEMIRLGSNSIPADLTKTLWMQRLPTHIQSVLTTSSDSIENLAKMADKIAEIEQPRTFAVEQNQNNLTGVIQQLVQEIAELKANYNNLDNSGGSRTRSRSLSRPPRKRSVSGDADNVCWYHFNYKHKARKCIAPCKFQDQQENSPPRQ
ncbi:unnamed protein product [Phaedon cochleariae]|uniref:DUF7041 domain-containing protein n=1 Tax=Phaedon cochleariae TaxID=80249 RepID=A0A9N9SHJ2_PHACE|nr:unnamed protein product [Phaedon cochleariae]